jgi:hypothetical protein
MAGTVSIALTSPRLQGGANLFQLHPDNYIHCRELVAAAGFEPAIVNHLITLPNWSFYIDSNYELPLIRQTLYHLTIEGWSS